MSPLRAIFLSVSRLPPALMLVIIIGLAIAATILVSSADGTTYNQGREQIVSNVVTGPHKKAVYARSYIPSGSRIENKQIEVRDTNDLELWDDAKLDTTGVVGSTSKHAIPANNQICQIDIATE